MLKYLFFGFFIQTITSLDDTLARIPVSASLTHTRKGKIALSLGTIVAVMIAIVIAIAFSTFFETLPYGNYVIGGLLLTLSLLVYFDVLKKRVSEKVDKVLVRPISTKRFIKLVGAGFLVSFVMIFDDIIALSTLFLDNSFLEKVAAIVGIAIATIIQISAVIYFAGQIKHLPHKKDIAAASLFILGLLVLFGVL